MEEKSINELFDWINLQYERYTSEEITEDEYMSNLEYYKKRLAASEEQVTEYTTEEEVLPSEKINPKKVRSTSIASLRAKLLDEMNG